MKRKKWLSSESLANYPVFIGVLWRRRWYSIHVFTSLKSTTYEVVNLKCYPECYPKCYPKKTLSGGKSSSSCPLYIVRAYRSSSHSRNASPIISSHIGKPSVQEWANIVLSKHMTFTTYNCDWNRCGLTKNSNSFWVALPII